MKIAILNDTHRGARNSAELFIEYQRRFYEEIFFPYLVENGISRILHLGDYYEHRKFINFRAAAADKKDFLDRLREYGILMDIIPGNHDVYYKNTNQLCSLPIMMAGYEDVITIHEGPVDLFYDDLKIALIPWINQENYQECMDHVSATDAKICAGHFEFVGFEMYPGMVCTNGMHPTAFEKFNTVLSGHFHTASQRGPIRYLGAQMEFTRSDAGDPKFFHILDTETGEIEAVHNPLTLFNRLKYDDTHGVPEFDTSDFSGKYIDIIVVEKKDHQAFINFLDRVRGSKPQEVRVIESFTEFHSKANENTDDAEGPEDAIEAYVDGIVTALDKEELKRRLRGLYIEAEALAE